MTIALLAALVAVNSVYLVFLDRNDKRAQAERVADREERQVLLQRIQAPEAAVYEHATRDAPQDSEPFPMSDEQLAEEEERRSVLEFIERHENGAS